MTDRYGLAPEYYVDDLKILSDERYILTQQIKYARRGRRERKKDLDTFYLVSAIYT